MNHEVRHNGSALGGEGVPPEPPANGGDPRVKLEARHLHFHYGEQPALKDVSTALHANAITAYIGPSGCGKSTLLRVFNRMYDGYPDQHVSGEVLLDGVDILDAGADVNHVRARIGMVFQIPAPFPMSIYENVAFGVSIFHRLSRPRLNEQVENALRRAALWHEVKDVLRKSALSLSGGQQQRLCIARTIATEPEVILFDEPCSALDPGSTAKVEETILELKADHAIAVVTHNMQQAARLADYTAFMYLGEVVEFGETGDIFTRPRDRRTKDFVTGRFG